MIVSHRHRFIFLKNPKVAGTSIEIALSRICGEDDIITPITKADEQKRKEQGGLPPKHYRPSFWQRLRGAKPLYNHMSAADVREHVGEEVWRGYRKFAAVRNPWDQVVSLYFMKKGRYRSFAEFLQDDRWQDLQQQSRDIVQINGQYCLDDYLLFETLADDLNRLLTELGVASPPEMIAAKSGYRKDGGRYREHYTEKRAADVAQAYQWLIDKFNYAF